MDDLRYGAWHWSVQAWSHDLRVFPQDWEQCDLEMLASSQSPAR